jgi:hypothetical protein
MAALRTARIKTRREGGQTADKGCNSRLTDQLGLSRLGKHADEARAPRTSSSHRERKARRLSAQALVVATSDILRPCR